MLINANIAIKHIVAKNPNPIAPNGLLLATFNGNSSSYPKFLLPHDKQANEWSCFEYKFSILVEGIGTVFGILQVLTNNSWFDPLIIRLTIALAIELIPVASHITSCGPSNFKR